MKVSYKMAHEIKEIAELIWNGENKKLYVLLNALKRKYNWSVSKTFRVVDVVSRQFLSKHYDAECGLYYPDWREFNNIYEFQIYLWDNCCQYTMTTKELMDQKI